MDQAFANREFERLISRAYTQGELDSLVASIWETPEPTAAELILAAEMEEYAIGATIAVFGPDAFGPTVIVDTRRGGRHRKPRKRLFLPVLRILKGEA